MRHRLLPYHLYDPGRAGSSRGGCFCSQVVGNGKLVDLLFAGGTQKGCLTILFRHAPVVWLQLLANAAAYALIAVLNDLGHLML